MMLGDDVLLWCASGPVLGRYMGTSSYQGCPVTLVTINGEISSRPFAPEIVTPAGGVIAALKRGSRFHWQEGTV